LTAALASILFVKNHPEEVGQVADGDGQTVSEIINDAASRRPRVYRTRDRWTLKEAAHTPTFWLLTLAAVGESVPGTSTIAHAVTTRAPLTCWHATVGNYFGPSSFPSILCAQLRSYTPAFVSLAAFAVLTAILLLFTRPPTRRSLLANSAYLASTNR